MRGAWRRGWCAFLAVGLLFARVSCGADSSEAGSTARFEPGPCPNTPAPIPALQTARCGSLVVPESRSKPNGRTIRLAVAIVPAVSESPQPDPVVFMTGGPGATGILDTPFLVDAGINRNRDLIIMAQRGTLYADPNLNCPELDRYYALQVSLVYDAPSTGRQQAAAARECHDRLVKAGIDLSAYNTTENAADFADLRRVLGIHAWNVYGYSYGSDLALSFMRDHPDGIRTVTIDSVTPPDIVSLPWTWSSAREGITTVFDACAAQPGCANHYPDLLGTFTRLVNTLEANPLVAFVRPPQGGAPVQVLIDGGTLVNMLVGNAVKPADVPAALYELAAGNPRRFLEVQAAASVVAEVPEQAQGMTQSIACREWEPYGSPDAILRAGRQEFPSFPATVLRNAPQLPFEAELCQVWDVPKGPASQRARVHSSIPTLVVSGTFDAKTGAEWGRYAASTLSQSTYVRINGIGHWVIAQSPCAQSIFQSFLATPLSPETACAAGTRPAPFTIDGGNPPSRFTRGPCPATPRPIPELATARCGQLTVPENRSRPTGRTISLSVAIVPADAKPPKPDPIVWLAGGPGDDAIIEIELALRANKIETHLNRDRDVIFMSQRGTYTAQPSLTCLEVDRFPAETLDKPFDAPDTGIAFAKATAECRFRLDALGAELSAYNTIESAQDLADLRIALGIAEWNVFGISYGTDLALTYMRLHPEGLRAVGIDGIFPPPLAGGVAAWTSAGEGINAVFRACSAQTRCRERYGDIGATFRSLVEHFEQNPQTVQVSVPGVPEPVNVMISGGMLVQWAVSPGTHIAANVPAAIDALAHGDATPIASLWAAIKLDPAGIGILGNGLYYGVSCGEWVPYESEESVIAAGQRAFPTFPLSVYKNAPNLQFMRSNCAVWHVPPVSSAIRDITASSIPTLVISAQYDAQTAPSFGPLVARTLTNATVVEIPNVAHVAFGSPSPDANACAHSIVRDFFAVLNEVDTSCTTRVPPTDFVITPR
jgi:pimeloyl-ACP methyl ester carboxylesterase